MIRALGHFQFTTLSAIQHLGRATYGMEIRRYLEGEIGKPVHMPQVYAALARLEKLKLVESHLDEKHSAGRRGRTRRYYEINAHGLQCIRDGGRLSYGAGPKEPDAYEEQKEAATA